MLWRSGLGLSVLGFCQSNPGPLFFSAHSAVVVAWIEVACGDKVVGRFLIVDATNNTSRLQ